jgi:hypothetical protein
MQDKSSWDEKLNDISYNTAGLIAVREEQLEKIQPGCLNNHSADVEIMGQHIFQAYATTDW